MSRFILIALLLSGMTVFGQQPLKDFYLKRSLKQDGQQFQFTVLDEDKRTILFYNQSKFYFWYKAQKVLSTQGGASGVLLHGAFEAFHSNKQLSQKGEFKRGLKHGKWLYWRMDGSLSAIEHWVNGVQRGEQQFFSEDGELHESIDMKLSKTVKKVGDSLITSHGNKQMVIIYDQRHNIVSKERKKNGVFHGRQVLYELRKKVKCEKYRNGELKIKSRKDEEQKLENELDQGLWKRIKSKFFNNADKELKEKKEKKEKPQKEINGKKNK